MRSLDKSRFQVTVASFYDGGGLRPELEALPGVRVVSLAKKGRWDALPFVMRLLNAMREARPHIVHSYMTGANELGLLGRLVGARVVWGLRTSQREGGANDPIAIGFFHAGALLSRFTHLIITNSHAGRIYHVANHYAAQRIKVVHNGIDTVRFQPKRDAGLALRRAWGVSDDELLIGLVGRLDPQKDHPTFVRMAAQVAQSHPKARFVCVGEGVPAYGAEMRALANSLGLGERLIWPGTSSDMPAVYNAFDLYVSSSRIEGFANVIGEAMACGLPCVVTDAGDSAVVVDDGAYVVPTGDPAALAAGVERVLNMPAEARAALGRHNRERIEREFSVESLTGKTEAMLRGIVPCAS